MNLFAEFQKSIRPFWENQTGSFDQSADVGEADESEEEDLWSEETAWLVS